MHSSQVSGEEPMTGERTVAQEALFCSYSPERHVPADHLLRSIDRLADLSGICEHLRPFYSEAGRPSIDPESIIWILIIGYYMDIRSERRLCEEVHLNFALWRVASPRSWWVVMASRSMPPSSPPMFIASGRYQGNKFCRQSRAAAPLLSIWRYWMIRRSAAQHPSHPSASTSPIRLLAGLRRQPRLRL